MRFLTKSKIKYFLNWMDRCNGHDCEDLFAHAPIFHIHSFNIIFYISTSFFVGAEQSWKKSNLAARLWTQTLVVANETGAV